MKNHDLTQPTLYQLRCKLKMAQEALIEAEEDVKWMIIRRDKLLKQIEYLEGQIKELKKIRLKYEE